jgi:hypothetical protein
MTDWKADLDALIEETLAFAKKRRLEPPVPRTIVEPNRLPPANLNNPECDEIRQRVASFKAHQERFAREREEFATSLKKRMLERSWQRRSHRDGLQSAARMGAGVASMDRHLPASIYHRPPRLWKSLAPPRWTSKPAQAAPSHHSNARSGPNSSQF